MSESIVYILHSRAWYCCTSTICINYPRLIFKRTLYNTIWFSIMRKFVSRCEISAKIDEPFINRELGCSRRSWLNRRLSTFPVHVRSFRNIFFGRERDPPMPDYSVIAEEIERSNDRKRPFGITAYTLRK